ncbi:MAG TPA: NADAR family protein [Kofleriaceae bacterium]|nr:NADAR family protein [Kofleriaceae bacterium]
MSDLPLDLDSLRRAIAGGRSFRYHLFYGHRREPDGVFSQWWPCAFEVDGQRYATAEQFTMAGKARLFGDERALFAILAEPDPAACKRLGRRVRGFDDAAWARARFDLVVAGNLAKFGQSDHLRAILLATGDAILVEASPTDRIWGIGLAAADPRAADPATWRGANLLGFALVKTRAALAAG